MKQYAPVVVPDAVCQRAACPGLRAGAQPRFSRQLRRPGLLSPRCGGIESLGWAPAFAGATKGEARRTA